MDENQNHQKEETLEGATQNHRVKDMEIVITNLRKELAQAHQQAVQFQVVLSFSCEILGLLVICGRPGAMAIQGHLNGWSGLFP